MKKIRKLIYIVLYILIIAAFIVIGRKDYEIETFANDQERFSSSFTEVPKDNNFKYLSSNEFISFLKTGKGIVLVGDETSTWSNRYAKYIYEINKEYNIEKIYYFDAKRTKELKNSNYYDILKLLKDNLQKTDSSNDNLFTPSLYLVENGKIIYYDSTSSVVKNSETVDTFWNEEKVISFKQNIRENVFDKVNH